MKKLLFFVGIIFLGAFTAHAQIGSGQAPLRDVSGMSASILGKLTSTLSLSDTQQQKISPVVTNYLTQKFAAAPLQVENPTGYTKKIASLQHGLNTKFKTILTATQYAQFLGLKPPSNDVTNVLSQLFY